MSGTHTSVVPACQVSYRCNRHRRVCLETGIFVCGLVCMCVYMCVWTTYSHLLIFFKALLSYCWSFQWTQPSTVPRNPLVVAMAPPVKVDQHLPLLKVHFLDARRVPRREKEKDADYNFFIRHKSDVLIVSIKWHTDIYIPFLKVVLSFNSGPNFKGDPWTIGWFLAHFQTVYSKTNVLCLCWTTRGTGKVSWLYGGNIPGVQNIAYRDLVCQCTNTCWLHSYSRASKAEQR